MPHGNPHPRQTMIDHTAKTPTQPSRRTQGHGAYSPSPVGTPFLPATPYYIYGGTECGTLVGTSFLPATPYYIYGSAEVGTGRPATAQRTECGADRAADFMRHARNKSYTPVGTSFLPATPYYIYRSAEVGTPVGASFLPATPYYIYGSAEVGTPVGTSLLPSQSALHTVAGGGLPPLGAEACRSRKSDLTRGGYAAHGRSKISSRVEIFFLPCGNFPPPVWKFSSSRVEISFLPCGNFTPPVWKFSSSRVEIFLLPCGNFFPPVWKFSSSRMEVFTPRKGLENSVYYLFIVSPSKISSL